MITARKVLLIKKIHHIISIHQKYSTKFVHILIRKVAANVNPRRQENPNANQESPEEPEESVKYFSQKYQPPIWYFSRSRLLYEWHPIQTSNSTMVCLSRATHITTRRSVVIGPSESEIQQSILCISYRYHLTFRLSMPSSVLHMQVLFHERQGDVL